jgi:hypothetical protein
MQGQAPRPYSIEVADVLQWSTAGTCAHTRRNILWATQGIRHQHRRSAYVESWMSRDLVASLLEPEAQSLEQRYWHVGIHHADRSGDGSNPSHEVQLSAIQDKSRNFEVSSFSAASLQEEQERELAPDNERERQVELPPASSPALYSLHEDVRHFVTHGVLKEPSVAFRAAFDTLRETTASEHYETGAWPWTCSLPPTSPGPSNTIT